MATHPKLVHYVSQGLVVLFGRITKTGWFDRVKDEYVFRNVVNDVSSFLQVGLNELTLKHRSNFIIFFTVYVYLNIMNSELK